MKIVISGASGLIGTALVPSLEAAGHEVVRLVRARTPEGPGEAAWDPAAGKIDASVIAAADAVINLNQMARSKQRFAAKLRSPLMKPISL